MEQILLMMSFALWIALVYALYFIVFRLPAELRQIREQLQRIEKQLKSHHQSDNSSDQSTNNSNP